MSDFRGELDLRDSAQLVAACRELSELCNEYAQPGTIGASGPADGRYFYGRLARTLAAAAERIVVPPPVVHELEQVSLDIAAGNDNGVEGLLPTNEFLAAAEVEANTPITGGSGEVPKRGPGRPRKNPVPQEAT